MERGGGGGQGGLSTPNVAKGGISSQYKELPAVCLPVYGI